MDGSSSYCNIAGCRRRLFVHQPSAVSAQPALVIAADKDIPAPAGNKAVLTLGKRSTDLPRQ